MVDFFNIDNCKKVSKPWGHELWIADGEPSHRYALKQILFLAGNRTSLQVHEFKSETNYVLSGYGHLLYHEQKFDFEKFKEGGYTKADIDRIISELQIIELLPGVVSHISPGHIHRVVAIDDLTFIEASTTELDDVYRLQDDSNRTHGLIKNEHL